MAATIHTIRECINNFVDNCSTEVIKNISADIAKIDDAFILELEKKAIEELNQATHHLAQVAQILERAHAHAIENNIELDCGRPKS